VKQSKFKVYRNKNLYKKLNPRQVRPQQPFLFSLPTGESFGKWSEGEKDKPSMSLPSMALSKVSSRAIRTHGWISHPY
jgi:hypothetical protein